MRLYLAFALPLNTTPMRLLVYSFLTSLLLTAAPMIRAQETADTTLLPGLDSLALLQELSALLGPAPVPTHSFYATVAVGNRLFSVRNNRLNARQESRELVLTPSISYMHKSGFSLTGGLNLVNQPSGMSVTQWSVMPAFDYITDSGFNAGISYTYFGVRDFFSPYSSPIQHDVFGSASYKKGWLQPSIGLGYSAGKYREFQSKDTVVGGMRRFIYDSATNQLQNFSVQLGVGHRFQWQQVFAEQDMLSVSPGLLLVGGAGKTTITHRTNAPLLLQFLNRRGRVPRLIQDQFAFESVGFNLDVQYVIGGWAISPQWYADYFFGKTTSARFTQNFQVSLSYFF